MTGSEWDDYVEWSGLDESRLAEILRERRAAEATREAESEQPEQDDRSRESMSAGSRSRGRGDRP